LSRAFVKEMDGDGSEDIPELAISPHRNLVTPAGLTHIDETLRRLDGELATSRAAEDRATVARVERDLRYWSSRRSTAEVVGPVARPETVRFGCSVELQTGTGERIRFTIVGEDESNPGQGRISYVSPLAAAMIGAAVGDEVEFRGGGASIASID
jgi:transcription elongation GreA/GreB family factor